MIGIIVIAYWVSTLVPPIYEAHNKYQHCSIAETYVRYLLPWLYWKSGAIILDIVKPPPVGLQGAAGPEGRL